MKKVSEKKIAIVVKNLEEGGAEKSAANLSFILKHIGFNVCFVMLENKIAFNHYGNIHVLKGGFKINFINKINQFLDFKNYINQQKFDFIIDFRGRTNTFREYLIYKFIYINLKNIVFTIHESKITNYIPSPYFLFKSSFQKAHKIITVSNKIEVLTHKKYKLSNLITIYNGINFKEIELLEDERIKSYGNYILAIGRLIPIKQFDKLINIYKETLLYSKDIKLLIIGDGVLKNSLKQIVEENKLTKQIIFLPFQKNPYKYMKKAKFLILPSKREGFPNVLIEALACNTPVIAFNCLTGPNEIIINNKNGLLVENQNFKELIKAIDRLILDDDLYRVCKENAKSSVLKFDLPNLAKLWNSLLDCN